MEKPVTRKCSQEVWFAIFTSLALFSVLLCFDYSALIGTEKGVNFLVDKQNNPLVFSKNKTNFIPKNSTLDSCHGKYIYIHNLPSRFNQDLLKNCKLLTRGTENSMCPYLKNNGLGPEIDGFEGVLSNKSWFSTNQFLLEVIFHNKMKRYKCLTNDSSLASAVFIPFYAGLDVSLRLWDPNISVRDSSARDLVDWLSKKPEWKTMWGRDHFLVAGRISWDFRRQTDESSDWGSKLRFLPQSMNMSMLSVEGSSWRNDYAIPYPTYFHPAEDRAVYEWQGRMRNMSRPYLFTFAGAPRPDLVNSIRGKVIDQCRASSSCRFIDCGSVENSCNNPVSVMKVFQSSVYCLQPPGDSYTRRSTFDSILAGCIPVFFHPGTAYSQYLWHFPNNYTKYSVYIPVKDVKDLRDGDIEKVLLGISKEEEKGMREEVIRLIPKIVYADPRSRLNSFKDAFDLAVKGVLERIEELRRVIKEGKDPSVGFAEGDDFKYTFSDWDKKDGN
ncbi:Xyloglucan galactosyltransferase KATAMARI1 [Morus notabilis]|uniref:Xyloglucan galactosyltransferase KATAMARI1 n=1 Tax=Morus notabilis TaxID=981085 RepID=W9RE59_9ROSA|nr:probable xyloglucan galactosyltransferase GT14 [Morus notabilis]EXB73697.1 Xyloglucan galactosyltransferase KATAMARI1 [Morus notabilis]